MSTSPRRYRMRVSSSRSNTYSHEATFTRGDTSVACVLMLDQNGRSRFSRYGFLTRHGRIMRPTIRRGLWPSSRSVGSCQFRRTVFLLASSRGTCGELPEAPLLGAISKIRFFVLRGHSKYVAPCFPGMISPGGLDKGQLYQRSFASTYMGPISHAD